MVEFNRGLNLKSEASKRFAKYSHWYYHPRLDIFAPSKFIGYYNTTHENYSGSGYGGQTQQILRTYFDPVPLENYENYLEKLIVLADSYGYKVSEKTLQGSGWIYEPKETVLEQFIKADTAYSIIEDEIILYEEGGKKHSVVNKYERNDKVRKAAILYHGTTCMGCGFNFEEHYGSHGKGFIEIHHLNSLSSHGVEHYVDPKEDIAVLCSNCHKMVHRHVSEPLTINQLIELIEINKKLRR
ncbi:HNH endonuclease [Paenibacillus sp. TSA_86.1]|uniref:HNH endonuclease n=1 Tax=Paenibacillus sp. TSA_86.1 TaxID=3415649 RepID=UPI0040465B70